MSNLRYFLAGALLSLSSLSQAGDFVELRCVYDFTGSDDGLSFFSLNTKTGDVTHKQTVTLHPALGKTTTEMSGKATITAGQIIVFLRGSGYEWKIDRKTLAITKDDTSRPGKCEKMKIPTDLAI